MPRDPKLHQLPVTLVDVGTEVDKAVANLLRCAMNSSRARRGDSDDAVQRASAAYDEAADDLYDSIWALGELHGVVVEQIDVATTLKTRPK